MAHHLGRYPRLGLPVVISESWYKARYCNPLPSNDMFNGFSAIDRQTELTDDDGSLTGYVKTISVNEDPFFHAPVDGSRMPVRGL